MFLSPFKVNLQSCENGLGDLNYDLCDLTCWEHLLAGEPSYRRDMVGVDLADPSTAVKTEKHLDMPASWVEKLDIVADGTIILITMLLPPLLSQRRPMPVT